MPNPTPITRNRLCHRCVGDDDLQRFIMDSAGRRGCSFCGRKDASTVDLGYFTDYLRQSLERYYSKAADDLPWESAEGGYQDWTADTDDLLFDEVGLDLPRDNSDILRWALVNGVGDDVWCRYDWLVLDHDASLDFAWRQFGLTIMHKRRFFFHDLGGSDGRDPDSRSPVEFLREICSYAQGLGLIKDRPAGLHLFRARPRKAREKHTTAASLGPAPAEFSTQSNRMNPPGIPMFYGADRRKLATAETRNYRVSLGTFETTRPIRILDLADLPPVPGFFSDTGREERLTLSFLHSFSKDIIKPVERNDRVNVDYIPTQVFTEFLRDHKFRGGQIDGVRYRSATGLTGANVVLFAAPEDVEGAQEPPTLFPHQTWLRLVEVKHYRPKRRRS